MKKLTIAAIVLASLAMIGEVFIFATTRESNDDVHRKAIKANYGEQHPILCIAPKTSDLCITYVQQAANDCGMDNVYYTGVFEGIHLNTNENLGASWHPNYLGHQKIAYSLIPYVATLTGWQITENPVK